MGVRSVSLNRLADSPLKPSVAEVARQLAARKAAESQLDYEEEKKRQFRGPSPRRTARVAQIPDCKPGIHETGDCEADSRTTYKTPSCPATAIEALIRQLL